VIINDFLFDRTVDVEAGQIGPKSKLLKN